MSRTAPPAITMLLVRGDNVLGAVHPRFRRTGASFAPLSEESLRPRTLRLAAGSRRRSAAALPSGARKDAISGSVGGESSEGGGRYRKRLERVAEGGQLLFVLLPEHGTEAAPLRLFAEKRNPNQVTWKEGSACSQRFTLSFKRCAPRREARAERRA